MRANGVFGNVEVRGGYCIVRKNILRYWGDSTTPIKGAGEALFDEAIHARPISLMNMFGDVLRK